MKQNNSIYKFSTLLGIAALLQIPTLFASNNADDYDFTTVISAPSNLAQLSTKPILNNLTNLLFYTGSQDKQRQSGFYMFNAAANSWNQYQLPVNANSSKETQHGVIAASEGPFGHSVALSYKTENDKTTQYLSNTVYGDAWGIQRILLQQNFTNLVSTDVYNVKNFITYGEHHQSILSSFDGNVWAQLSAPNTCLKDENCSFNNKHFASVYNGYLLLQETKRSKSEENNVISFDNKLLFTQNYKTWHVVNIPFSNDQINNAFKTKNDGLIASVYSKEDGTHKLWFTKDFKEWQNFNLPKDTKVLDAKTGYKDYITLSLGHDNKSDIVILDPKENTTNIFASFDGEVTSMNWYNNSLYISGNFVNFRDNSNALLARMTKKTHGESTTDNAPEQDNPGYSADQIIIDVDSLAIFNS